MRRRSPPSPRPSARSCARASRATRRLPSSWRGRRRGSGRRLAELNDGLARRTFLVLGPSRGLRFLLGLRPGGYRKGEDMSRVGKFAILGALAALAVSAGTTGAATKDHTGGTLKLLAKAAGGTLDPQVNYTLQYWQLYQATYDGLLGFKKAGGDGAFTVVPDLAESLPKPTNGGKTWVFKLRKGIKFSNGKPVTVNDVVASFQRIFKVKSPTSGDFYSGIVGAKACLAKPATCTLKGGVIGNAKANTVTINLVAPDPEFKYKLAVPHASILPASSPPSDAGTKPIPGTGPYYFASYNPNKQLVMKRNPYFKEWSQGRAAGRVSGPDHAVLRSHRRGADHRDRERAGRLDARGSARRPPRTRWARSTPTRRTSRPLTAFWYAPMNTNLAPFNNLKARQAVNFAIDRNAAREDLRRAEARGAVVPGAAAGLPRARRLLPVHEEPRHEVVGAGPREGEAARQGVRHRRPEGRRPLLGRRGEQGGRPSICRAC